LSATLPNYKDVATFLRVNAKGLFYFDRSWRPVPLEMTFAGVTVGKNAMKQKLKMNEIAYEKCAHALARNRQVLVFVHSRKETVKTAQAISELARKNGTSELFSPSQDDAADYKLKLRDVSKSKNKDVRELYTIGMGCHHAGMLRKDRHLTENLFKHLVIKKDLQHQTRRVGGSVAGAAEDAAVDDEDDAEEIEDDDDDDDDDDEATEEDSTAACAFNFFRSSLIVYNANRFSCSFRSRSFNISMLKLTASSFNHVKPLRQDINFRVISTLNFLIKISDE